MNLISLELISIYGKVHVTYFPLIFRLIIKHRQNVLTQNTAQNKFKPASLTGYYK